MPTSHRLRGRWVVDPAYFRFFFFNDTATTDIYTLSLHDALPIWRAWISSGWPSSPDVTGGSGVRASHRGLRGQTWPRPPLHWWGIPPTRPNLPLGRHLRRAMLPKFSTYKIRIWAIMPKNFHISCPNGRLDRHRAQGWWA